MREEYGAYIKKYDSPLSSYMHSKLNEGALIAEDEATNGMGEWAGRFGRRVLREDDRGFVYCHPFVDVETATVYMDECHMEWETEEEAEVVEEGEPAHYDSYGLLRGGRVVCMNRLMGFDE